MEQLASGIYRITVGQPELLTPVSVLQPEPRQETLAKLKNFDTPFLEKDIRFQRRAGGCLLELPLSSSEDLYGLGLMMKSFRQTGLKKQLRANSDPTADTGDSHAPVPFYLSTAGYGVLVDTARYASFYLGNCKMRGSRQDREGFASAGTEIGHWWVKSGSGNLFVDIPCAKGVDLYLFCGEDILDALARYNLFSGGGVLPPIWGLGVMYRAYMHADQAHVLKLAKLLRETKMPCDMFGLEPGWQTHFYSCTYQWDPERFPAHREMLQQLRELGYQVNLWEHAYVNPKSPIYQQISPYAGNQYVWDGLVPDFSTEGAQKVFGDYHRGLADEGVSGFKLDECDCSDFTANWGFANFAQFPSGMDGEQMHMLFGALYQKTMTAIYREKHQRTWGEVRNSTALCAPYPYVLYSDLYAHEDFVRGMASAACSGILWTPEVRQADSDEELLMRIAAAVVSPQMVLNCYQVKTPPWTQWDMWKNLDGELLENREELTAKCRELLNFRMKLIPLLYAAYYRYEQTGVPPIRPLVLDYPADETARPIYDEFILGDGLLAAPLIYGGGRERRIWLPEGEWYDYWTDEKLDGSQWITRPANPGDLPLFVRAGTLLALAEPVQHVDRETRFQMHFTAYGANASACELISDDGETDDYKHSAVTARFVADKASLCGVDPYGRYAVASFRRVGG